MLGRLGARRPALSPAVTPQDSGLVGVTLAQKGRETTPLPAPEPRLVGKFPSRLPPPIHSTDPRRAWGGGRARPHPTSGTPGGERVVARSQSLPCPPAPPLPDGTVGARAHRAQPLQPLRHLPHRLVQLLPVEAGARTRHVRPRPPPHRSASRTHGGRCAGRGFEGVPGDKAASCPSEALLSGNRHSSRLPGAVPGRMGLRRGEGEARV